MKVAKVITAVIIVVLIAALIAGLVLFMDNGQSNFYVEYGGQRISSDVGNIELAKGGYTIFNVKNVFGNVINGMSQDDYEVTITLYEKNVSDVEFTVGDDTYGLYDIEDFSPAFKITKTDGAFTVFIPRNCTITDVLSAIYPNDEVAIDNDSVSLWTNDCFVLNVKSLSEQKTISISFH